MTEISSIADVLALFERFGDDTYGEDVTQTEHALQCAAIAEADGASEALIVAALLHDVGHLVHLDETGEVADATVVTPRDASSALIAATNDATRLWSINPATRVSSPSMNRRRGGLASSASKSSWHRMSLTGSSGDLRTMRTLPSSDRRVSKLPP